MTAVDDRVHAVEQPLFRAALIARMTDASDRLRSATRRRDALLMEIFAAEVADLAAVAAAHGLSLRAE